MFTFDNLIALFFLAAMEIVLGIDNIVFLVIISSKLPVEQQPKARKIGLFLAMGMRILLLLGIGLIVRAKDPLFHLTDLGLNFDYISENEHVNDISIRDLILLGGGLFLVAKAVFEIHEKVEGHETHAKAPKAASFGGVLAQIVAIDIIFSIDSVLTAVGMTQNIPIMIAAVIIAVVVMMIFSEPVSRFVERHPTVKMLALSFLILIGVMLIAEGTGFEIPKGYIYFAMFFSVMVEMLNLKIRGQSEKFQAGVKAQQSPATPAPGGK